MSRWLIALLFVSATAHAAPPELRDDDMNQLLVNRSLLEQAAALRFSAIEANLAKVTITDNAIQAVNIALELTGNHGLSRQNPLERHYRNVLCGRVHTPQSDSAWLAAGNFVFQSQG